jgi:hypothetical protein
MHRVDTDGNVANAFTDGTPGVTQATVVDAAILNAMQNEIANAIESGGVALVKGTNNQLASVIVPQSEYRPQTYQAQASEFFSLDDTSSLIDVIREVFVDPTAKIVVAVGSLSGNMATVIGIGTVPFQSLTVPSTPAGDIFAIASNGTTLVGVGTTGKIITMPVAGSYSWTNRTGALGSEWLLDVKWCASSGLFICCGITGGLQTSPDGITWTSRTNPSAGVVTAGIAINGLTVIIGTVAGSPSTTSGIRSSNGGISWATMTMPVAVSGTENPTVCAGLFKYFISGVTNAGADSNIFSSSDGATWTNVKALIGTDPARPISLAGCVLVITTGDSNGCFFSIDGTTWIPVRLRRQPQVNSKPFYSAVEGRLYLVMKNPTNQQIFSSISRVEI